MWRWPWSISGTILTFTWKKWQKTFSIACFTTEILTRTSGGKGVLITWLWCSAQSCYCHVGVLIQGAEKSLARPGRKQANVSVRMAWISFGALPRREKTLMAARVSMLLKSRTSLTCFRARFLPGRAKDLSAPDTNEVMPLILLLLLPVIKTKYTSGI